MTDRVNALVVVLDKDIRTDDVESLIEAIKHFRGVLSVFNNIADASSQGSYKNAIKGRLSKRAV